MPPATPPESQAERDPPWLRLAPAIFLLLWSAGFAFAKMGLAHAEPLTFLALRYGLVLLVLLPLLPILRPPLPDTSKVWRDVIIVGFLIQALYFGLSYLAFSHGVSAGGLALIVSLQPILVAVLAPRLVAERVGLKRWGGLGLGLAGAALVILARSRVEATSAFALACAFGALGSMTAAALYEKRCGTALHPVMANLIQYAVGFAVVAPMAWALEDMRVEWTAELLTALAYLVVGNSIVSVTLLLAMIRRGEVARVSALFFLVPPMAALIAWLMIGEAMPPLAWIGMACAAVGVVIASRSQKR